MFQKKNKGLTLIFIALLSISLLVACAPERDVAPNNSNTPSDNNGNENGIPEKPEKLTVWVNDSDNDMNSMATIAENYKQETGISVELVPVGARDQANAMSLDAPSGNGPDLWFATHNSMGRNILQGLAEPFDIDESIIANYLPEAIKAVTHDGEIYNLPQVVETVALYYNKELIPEAPETWEELEAFAKEFTDPSKEQYGFLYDATNFYYSNMFLEGYGGYIFGYDEKTGYDADDIGLDSEGAIEGAKLIQSWFEQGFIPKSVTEDIMHGLFTEGKVGAVMSGPWSLNDYTEALGDNVGVVPLPKLSNGNNPPSFLGVKGWVLSPYSEHKYWATDLALFITNEESLTHHFEVAKEIPARPGILESDLIKEDPFFSAFAEQSLYAVPTPNNPEISQTWEPMANALTFLADGDDPKEVLEEAVNFLREQIALANSSAQ